MTLMEKLGGRGLILVAIALTSMAAASSVWLLNEASAALLPISCALVAGVVLAPLVDYLDKTGLPRGLGALAVFLLFIAVLALIVVAFYPVVTEAFERAPVMWRELEQTMGGLRDAADTVEKAQKQVSDSINEESATAAQSASDGQPEAQEEKVRVPGLASILSYIPGMFAQILIFGGVLYFFLLTRNELYEYFEKNTKSFTKKVLCQAEHEVSSYFLTITLINAVLGVSVAVMTSLFGMSNPLHWGLAAFLANFILYLGPICFCISLLIGGIIMFDGVWSFAPAAVFLMFNTLEGYFITPSLVGRNMSVNPLLVFVALVLWMWLWGAAGGIIAIPILVWVRQLSKAVKQDI